MCYTQLYNRKISYIVKHHYENTLQKLKKVSVPAKISNNSVFTVRIISTNMFLSTHNLLKP